MTPNQFVSKYNGKRVCHSGACQCVALARMYVQEVLGFPQFPIVRGANDVWGVASTARYTKIKNAPTNYPKKGDIIIWKKEYSGYGHIAIVVEADVRGVLSFDQNHTGRGDLPQLVNHSYNLVLGWLRPKGVNMSCETDLKKCLTNKQKIWDVSLDRKKKLAQCQDALGKLQIEFDTASKIAEQEYNDMVKRKDQDITELNKDVEEWKLKALEGITGAKVWAWLFEKVKSWFRKG